MLKFLNARPALVDIRARQVANMFFHEAHNIIVQAHHFTEENDIFELLKILSRKAISSLDGQLKYYRAYMPVSVWDSHNFGRPINRLGIRLSRRNTY